MKSSSEKESNLARDLGMVKANNISKDEASQHDEETATVDQALVEPSSLQQQEEPQQQRAATGFSKGEDQPNHCMMQIPSSLNIEEGEYVIYLGDYETGDTVVWSAEDCVRVFHHSECSRPFLAKGKRCPCHGLTGPGISSDERIAAVVKLVASCHNSEEVGDVEEVAKKS
jgi:hypothetical protein